MRGWNGMGQGKVDEVREVRGCEKEGGGEGGEVR